MQEGKAAAWLAQAQLQAEKKKENNLVGVGCREHDVGGRLAARAGSGGRDAWAHSASRRVRMRGSACCSDVGQAAPDSLPLLWRAAQAPAPPGKQVAEPAPRGGVVGLALRQSTGGASQRCSGPGRGGQPVAAGSPPFRSARQRATAAALLPPGTVPAPTARSCRSGGRSTYAMPATMAPSGMHRWAKLKPNQTS